MADVPIVSRATVAAPKDYVIPNSQEIAPKAIRAVIDGTGAAGTFIPALQLIAPGGDVMWTALDRNLQLGVGTVASVSWFPRVVGQTVVLGGPPGQGCVRFVGPPTGVAATDTATIQAACDSLPAAGGIVQLCRGNYAINPLTLTTPVLLAGHGRGGGTGGATQLSYSGSTGVAITVAATSVTLRDFALQNTSGVTPVSGSGVQLGTNANHAGATSLLSVSVRGFFTNVDLQYPGSSYIFHRCQISDMVSVGISVQNLANADEGDGAIMDSFIITGPNNLGGSIKGIAWKSSGGLRIIGNKFNSTGGPPGPANSTAAEFEPSDGISTSIVLVSSNSIENYSYGVVASVAGGGSTGKLSDIVVSSNEILAVTTGVYVAPPAASLISNISVLGNSINGSTIGLSLANIDNIKYGPNVYSGCTTNISVGGGVTNATAVGGG